MHLAVLTYSFPPEIGGVQTYLAETMRRLGDQTTVTIITPIPPNLTQIPEPYQRFTLNNYKAFTFMKALQQTNPDRILLGHTHPQLLLAALLYRNPFAVIAHGNDYLAAQKRWHRPLFNWMLAQARPLITQSQTNQKRLQTLGLSASCIVHPGADPQHFKPKLASRSKYPRLLSIGRLVSRKGFDLVLQALPRVRQFEPEIHLEIVGDGPERSRLEQLVDDLELQSAVTFAGQLADEEVLAAYQRAHLFIMPAREEIEIVSIEGFGIVYLEASACELPVIAARTGGVGEAVKDGYTGLLIPPNDSVILANTIISLLQNPGQMRQLGQNGREWVLKEMNWDVTAHKLAAALNL